MRIKNIDGILHIQLKHKGQIIEFQAKDYREALAKAYEIKKGVKYAI